jgi:hypothetical protein
MWRRSPIRQASGGLEDWKPGCRSLRQAEPRLGLRSPGGAPPGGPERERTHAPSPWGPRVQRMGGNSGEAKGCFPLPEGQGWYGSLGAHRPASRRQLQAAILESPARQVRQVWSPGRRSLACPRPPLEPAKRGSETAVCRPAAAGAKRGRQGPHTPAGARPAGLRGGEQRPRSVPRGGAPGRRTPVAQAGANAARSAGMSGSRRKRGARRRQGPDRPAWCLRLKPYWGKPTARHLRGGGWHRGGWLA